jgi:hypothetical protein
MQQQQPQPSPPSSSASSTDLQAIQGQLTLAQFIHAIEVFANDRVNDVSSTSLKMSQYRIIVDNWDFWSSCSHDLSSKCSTTNCRYWFNS